jgi:hypothetical protein
LITPLRRAIPFILIAAAFAAPCAAQPPAKISDPLHQALDELLDIYVRDGFVYYNALKAERGRFDAYVRSLGEVGADTINKWPPPRQLAFWINAYNAFVLQTVIDHFPIRGKSPDYPASSIRQIPGAFERRTFRAGGRTLTLDAIERDVIAPFGDARAILALGRGAVGGGRLKSEAFVADRLDEQLDEMTRELVTHSQLIKVDAGANELRVNAVFSWREQTFTSVWANRAPGVFDVRSPIERAVLAMIDSLITPNEREFLARNQFRMVFQPFDWTLNDLSSRK